MMTVFVTGVNGQLGRDVVKELVKRGFDAVGSDIQEAYDGTDDGPEGFAARYVPLDITDEAAVGKTLDRVRPDAIIHCAAWTAVDAAEEEENAPKVFAVNAAGTEHVAKAAKAIDAKLLYISTDYVFDGTGTSPREPDDKSFAPLNVYGKSKLEGEFAVTRNTEKFFIVRIAWVFGLNGNNFIKTMIRVGKTRDTVRVVNDQIGTPTYTADLSRLLVDMIETERYGFYHATNEGGYVSWYDFCLEIYRQYGLETKVVPVTSAEYGQSKAARPENSRLSKAKLLQKGFEPLPDWRDALKRYLQEANL